MAELSAESTLKLSPAGSDGIAVGRQNPWAEY